MMQDIPNYFLIAIKEILQEFKVNPALQLDSKLVSAFKIIDDEHQPIKQFMIDLNFQDFEWQYFNECAKFCFEQNIFPQGYDFLKKYPKKPKNVTEFLNYFTIAQLREMAKERNIKRLPTRKDDIIAHISNHTQLSDFSSEITDLLKMQITAYKQAVFKAKCQFLISAVHIRAHALRDMCKLTRKNNMLYYNAQLYGLQSLDDDDWVLVHYLIGEYPQTDPKTGRINTTTLPPYFLGDTVHLFCDIDRDKSRQMRQQLPNTLKQQTQHTHNNHVRANERPKRKKATEKESSSVLTYLGLIIGGFFLYMIWKTWTM